MHKNVKSKAIYHVAKLEEPLTIDCNWDKSQWNTIDSIELKYFMGKLPEFQPVVHVKLMYDTTNLYVIFRVNDHYVQCKTKDTNGCVWEDSCVEFFFAPDCSFPGKYFNLETNCGGTALMKYTLIPKKDFKILEPEDIKEIKIAHSLPEQILNEIIEPVTWTIEYKMPFAILEKYAKISHPAPGISWRANFYKIADKTSNPHYLTWSFVDNAQPEFHLPGYFGTLVFQ